MPHWLLLGERKDGPFHRYSSLRNIAFGCGSAIPYLISDSGTITFKTEIRGGRGMNEWRKANFDLHLNPSGKHSLKR
jgi:hypothetical protein